VFEISITMGVTYELQLSQEMGASYAQSVLVVMVAGLQEELQLRMEE
jgi:hypothetical protein